MEHLSQSEIDSRMVELYNYRRLYPELRRKYDKLKAENQRLKAEIIRERKEREETVEALKLQIEELREMVFGRCRGDDDTSGKSGQSSVGKEPPEKKLRPPASYRRCVPKDNEVTAKKHFGIDACPDCGEALTNLREAVRYREDIVIPALSRLKLVEKQTIETGFCPHCRKWRSTVPIGKQICSLGEQVRLRIVYCVTVLGQTVDKVARDLADTFGITVSDGEIIRILTTEAAKLLPEYHDIDARIREAPCKNSDETSWPVQSEGEGQWAWVKTASDGPETVFRLGRSRGKGNAQELFANNQSTVTDDYAAYDDIPQHGLCWAHPKRKFQDLAESATLIDERRRHCREFYVRFCTLMAAVKASRVLPYDRQQRAAAAAELRLCFAALCSPDPADPKKLATLKKTFQQNTEKYLLCVLEKDVPMTNNKAERSLRPLVIKRKLSFGSKTQKGADVMSILLSVCLTTWWKQPQNFYTAYCGIVRKWQAV